MTSTGSSTTGSLAYYALPALAGAVIAGYVWRRYNSSARFALDPECWQRFQLVERLPVTTNTSIFRFKLPHAMDSLKLATGRHLQVRAIINGKEVVRSYTPISLPDDQGFFELMVKVYPTGTVSRHIGSLNIGDWLECRGPKGSFEYRPNMVSHLGMIAGGTGITPMLQVIKAVLCNPDDRTQISLVFGNLTEEDILLKSELDELATKHGDRFRVHYVVNEAKDKKTWRGDVGLITPEIIKEHIASPGAGVKVLMCGPPPMNKAMAAHLAALGYNELQMPSTSSDMLFKF
jgi:cytochrome-b5 reductase